MEINGASLNAPESEAVIIFEQLAAGLITEAELAQWLAMNSIQA